MAPPVAPPVAAANFEPACNGCGAVSATEYSPSAGAGIWSVTNSSGVPTTVPVALTGMSGQAVTLVLTNETGASVVMKAPGGTEVPSYNIQASAQYVVGDASANPQETFKEQVEAFNRDGWKQALAKAAATPHLQSVQPSGALRSVYPSVGATRVWNACQDFNYTTLNCNDANPNRDTQLLAQGTASDGRVIQVWVESSEIGTGKVTTARAVNLANAYAKSNGVHDTLKDLGGAPWGPHTYGSQLIADISLPIDIVLLNLTPNGQPLGMVGYFWSVNNFSQASISTSNAALAFFMDTETLYLDPKGENILLSTLAHEGTHMTSFYRRSVVPSTNRAFATWLEEMTAMMAEDFAEARVTPGFNGVTDNRLPYFLNTASYNCSITSFSATTGQCFGYAVNGTFGAYLSRQLGAPFYKTLLASTETDSFAALDNAIRAHRPMSSLTKELRKWNQSTVATAAASKQPAGFGYPARADSGYNLTEIDLKNVRSAQTFPYAPYKLSPYSSFPWKRTSAADLFQESVEVPPGATLSVIVRGAD
jgi:hypothetical protein